jgi:hypothetical protein
VLKKKTIATTAFLSALIFLAFIAPFSWVNPVDACKRHKPRPPLGRTIVKHFVYPDGTPIGAGLQVDLWNREKLQTQTTDATGTVAFAGLTDGTFTAEFNWQGVHYTETLRINCTQITWEFTNTVSYWTLQKTFYYDTVPPEPISELRVTLDGQTGYTDHNGLVTFANLKAGTYTLEWVWGSVTHDEEVDIGFQTATPIVLTNYLEPKSGGAKTNLHLPEEMG